MAVEAHQGREGGVVEARGHRHADQAPGQKQQHRPLRQRQGRQTGRKQAVGADQHRTAAMVIDQLPRPSTEHRRDDQGKRKGGKDRGHGHAEVRGHRRGQHGRQVVRRGPGQGLRGAQAGDHRSAV
ncbi:hypothetical protein FQZ97_963530 [compost metagenome]